MTPNKLRRTAAANDALNVPGGAAMRAAADAWENENSILNAIIDVDAEKYAEQRERIAELKTVVDRDHDGLTFACSAHQSPELSCDTCYVNLRDLLSEHVQVGMELRERIAELEQQVAELRKVVQQALNVERQIGPHDATRGPHTGMIARYEDVLRKTAPDTGGEPE